MPEDLLNLEIPQAADFDALTVLWESSVRATHHFLDDADIESLRPLVREQYFPNARLLALRGHDDRWLAFMGIAADELQALFVHPSAHRQGIGRRMAQHAIEVLGVTRVEGNEQNPGAVARADGFCRGKPFGDGWPRPSVPDPAHAPG